MESEIVKNLQPEFSPVAVVWSNTIPEDANDSVFQIPSWKALTGK